MYPTDLIRVSVKYLPEPSDAWHGEEAIITFLMRYHPSGLVSTFTWSSEMAWLPGQLAAKWGTHWGSGLSGLHSTEAQIVEFKCAHLDAATGHTLDEGAYAVPDGTLRGTSPAGMMPPEVAACISSWAYVPGSFAAHKGRKRGRFYLPYLSAALADAAGQISTAYMTSAITAYQSLFNDVQGMHTEESSGVDGDYFDFVVASKVDATWHNVDWVSIDNHFDSQRRRQHQVPATRQVLSISHA